jgi:pSer/pThr/pTyr-binding forkhead associated (FHA) protein
MDTIVPAAYLEAEIDGRVERFALRTDRPTGIGRSAANDLVLRDQLVGRNHAMLQQSGDGLFYIAHLGCRNGTFVNGVRIEAPAVLHHGDRVVIGQQEFIFHQPDRAQ